MLSKGEIINWFKDYTGATEVALVDETFDSVARHVCCNSDNPKIWLLPKKVYPLLTVRGVINLEYYQCQVCGKLILGKNFL